MGGRSEIRKLFKSLTIEKRLDAIKFYLNSNQFNGFYIFPLEGIKGLVKKIQLGNVYIYNPAMENLINYDKENLTTHDQYKHYEYFSRDDDKGFLNACVKNTNVNDNMSKDLSIESIERVLDVLRLYFPKYKTDLKVLKENYIKLDDKYNYRGEGRDPKISKFKFYYDLNEEGLTFNNYRYKDINKYCNLINKPIEDLNNTEKKLINSLHFYRKAQESTNKEEQFLNYWISFENIFNEEFEENIFKYNKSIFPIIKEKFPPIGSLNYIRHIIKNTHNNLSNYYLHNQKKLNIPDEIIKSCKLHSLPKSVLKIKDFIDNLQILIGFPFSKIIKDRLVFLKNLFSDNTFLKEEIINQENYIKNDIFLIYRLRNKMFHKAHYDNEILPHYINLISYYSSTLISKIYTDYINNPKLSVKEIILNYYIKISLLKEKNKKGLPIDLFDGYV